MACMHAWMDVRTYVRMHVYTPLHLSFTEKLHVYIYIHI